jgi:hypothetical protein
MSSRETVLGLIALILLAVGVLTWIRGVKTGRGVLFMGALGLLVGVVQGAGLERAPWGLVGLGAAWSLAFVVAVLGFPSSIPAEYQAMRPDPPLTTLQRVLRWATAIATWGAVWAWCAQPGRIAALGTVVAWGLSLGTHTIAVRRFKRGLSEDRRR